MTFDARPYLFWQGLGYWSMVVVSLLAILLLTGCLVSLLARGKSGPVYFLGSILGAVGDFFRVSPRRIYALASLTVKEAFRRKIVVIAVIFILLFMFGSWFLDNPNNRADLQIKTYIKFVLTAISWLILMLMLFLACWGLPSEIKDRSLHTVVTKPVRRNEIVIGRILGYVSVGTLILLLVGLSGYIWIDRQVQGEVRDQLTSRVPVYGELTFVDRFGNLSRKGINTGDIWEFRSSVPGASRAAAVWDFPGVTADRIEKVNDQGEKIVELEANFEAFRTHKGKIDRGLMAQFRVTNRLRTDIARLLGTSAHLYEVKDDIENGQFTTAAEEFRKIATDLEENQLFSRSLNESANPEQANQLVIQVIANQAMNGSEYLNIEMSLEESAKITDYLQRQLEDGGWAGSLSQALREASAAAKVAREKAQVDPKGVTDAERQALAKALNSLAENVEQNSQNLQEHLTDRVTNIAQVEIQEYRGNLIQFSPQLESDIEQGRKTYDLYRDLVRGERLQVEVACLDNGQFLTMARPDLFIRTPDRPFAMGYSKALLGIWMTMVMVIVLGVTASTFVKGPVATLLTFTLVILGSGARGGGYSVREFMNSFVGGELRGGGPVENYYRLIKHMNDTTPLEAGTGTSLIKGIDSGLVFFMKAVREVIPDFGYVDQMPLYVQNGFDVPWVTSLLPAIMVTLGLLLPCLLIGHFSLKFREIEAK